MNPKHKWEQFAECKGPYKHAWFDHDGSGFRATSIGTPLHFQCLRCGTIRRDVTNYAGDLMSRRYYYPEGYRDSKDERPSTAQLRLHAVKVQRRNLRTTKDLPRLHR